MSKKMAAMKVSKDKMRGNDGGTRGYPAHEPAIGMDGDLYKRAGTDQRRAVEKFLGGKHLSK